MKALFSAMAFLTVIPVPQKWCLEPEKLGRSVVFFPFVGLLIGGLLVPVTGGLFRILPALPAGVL
ncbi:MAG: adenosylcobinamide-GDP ribazoletransferase, partial [Planctomycetota bacterium]